MSPVTNHPDISTAPVQLIPLFARTGDSGTNKNVATVAPADMIRGNQKSQW